MSVSKKDTVQGALDYRSKLAATPISSDSGKPEAKMDGVERPALPLSPTCPLRTRFLYTLR